jgi:hypothetical protein
MLGDTASATRDATEARGILSTIDDSWGLVHADAMLGAIAQVEHRLDEAAAALYTAATRSSELGFAGQAALHLATLGRIQQRAGAASEAAETLSTAIDMAERVGDGRLAATARLNLARARRADGDNVDALRLLMSNARWYAAAGGGDGELLNRCLLAAATGDITSLEQVIREAREQENVEVVVCALDALARDAVRSGDALRATDLLAEADGLAASVVHVLDDCDRIDAAQARQLVEVEAP